MKKYENITLHFTRDKIVMQKNKKKAQAEAELRNSLEIEGLNDCHHDLQNTYKSLASALNRYFFT